METLKTGDLAYYDTFAGLIPCKVLNITGPTGLACSSQNVTFKLTANRGAYRKGEVMTEWSLHVIPRKSVWGHGQRIHAYNVIGDNNENNR